MACHCWMVIPFMAKMASISSMSEMASPIVFRRKSTRHMLAAPIIMMVFSRILHTHLIDDIHRVLQHESSSLCFVIGTWVLRQLMKLIFSWFTEHHLVMTRTQCGTPQTDLLCCSVIGDLCMFVLLTVPWPLASKYTPISNFWAICCRYFTPVLLHCTVT